MGKAGGKFELSIELSKQLGTYEDVAEVLAAVARSVGHGNDVGTIEANGELVGRWRFIDMPE